MSDHVAPDPDLVAIYRRRLSQRQCVRCAAPAGRWTLCATCRIAWRWCFRGEHLYPLPERGIARRGASQECPACKKLRQRAAGGHGTREMQLARQRARTHPLLPNIVQMTRQGKRRREIAVALQINPNTLSSIIAGARRTGRWPARIERGKHWRRGLRAHAACAACGAVFDATRKHLGRGLCSSCYYRAQRAQRKKAEGREKND